MLIDFSRCRTIPFQYGGRSCRKQCIIYKDEPYMLKLPCPLPGTEIENDVGIVVREYLGSQIYASLGVPVHETLLGTLNGLVVVACRHMQLPGEDFVDFSTLKEDYLSTGGGCNAPSKSRDLRDTLEIVGKHPWLIAAGGAVERFWDMFVIDLLIDNFDRNNGNWGILTDRKAFRLAPVFDNGSCFGQIPNRAAEGKPMIGPHTRRLVFAGHNLTPFELMHGHGITACNHALRRVKERFDLSGAEALIDELGSVGLVASTQADAYCATLEENFKKYFLHCIGTA